MKVEQEIIDKFLFGNLKNSERKVEVPFMFENLPEPPAKILDVGCCYSPLMEIMTAKGFDMWGIDMINCCANFPKFVHGDARKMTFKDNEFDAITCISVIEHVGKVETPYGTDSIPDETGDIKMMGEMVRTTKPGGKIILTIPYGHGDEAFNKWVKFYNKDSVNELIKGTEIIKAVYSIREPIFDEKGELIEERWRTATEEEASKQFSMKAVISNLSLLLKVK